MNPPAPVTSTFLLFQATFFSSMLEALVSRVFILSLKKISKFSHEF
jgi:hypothetical protein